jgi:phosphotransferase system  glucose/maltose/N-acetylglucosamine-specific IIC component
MDTSSQEPTEPKVQRRDWMDRVMSFYDGRAAETWFTWVEWVLVTGALYAIASASSSTIFFMLAAFSALLVMIYSAYNIERFLEPSFAKSRRLNPLARWVTFIVLALLQLAVFSAVSRVLNAMLSSATKLS